MSGLISPEPSSIFNATIQPRASRAAMVIGARSWALAYARAWSTVEDA
jgi:hypothetical protein